MSEKEKEGGRYSRRYGEADTDMEVSACLAVISLSQGVCREAGDRYRDACGCDRRDDPVDGHRHLKQTDDFLAGGSDEKDAVGGANEAVGNPRQK